MNVFVKQAGRNKVYFDYAAARKRLAQLNTSSSCLNGYYKNNKYNLSASICFPSDAARPV